MPLAQFNIKPGFNKQTTPTGAENQYVDGDFVRFRKGLPEKIGGWRQLTPDPGDTIVGAVRAQHTWADLDGRKYAALGSSKVLIIYYEGAFYDVTPLESDITGATFDTTDGDATVTVNKASHGLDKGDLFKFTSVTPPSGSGYLATDFTDNVFIVVSVTTDSFIIEMATAATGDSSDSGSATIQPYVDPGPEIQTYGYGWGTETWSSSSWGTASAASGVILPPGKWSIDNYGQKLIATISNGKTFEWDPIQAEPNALSTRATEISSNPTASLMTLVSDKDRHLIHLATETTIGDTASQDPMFIRFSDQETLSTYTPTATNTAGTFRLDDGTEIRGAVAGKDYTLIVTNTAAYTMQFVGPPFTFSIRKVGSNCGLIGKDAIAYVDGVVYWMGSNGGFFAYDGTVKALPCSVEDFVFTIGNTGDLGLNYAASGLISVGINNLYNELNWFYASNGADQIDRVVTYNFDEKTWATGSLARTSWEDAIVYDLPYATEYDRENSASFPIINGINEIPTDDVVYPGRTFYYAHETGEDELFSNGTAESINAFIQTGDIDLKAGGEGEYFLSMSRFFPDFKKLVGQVKITLNLKNFPQSTETGSTLGPFEITEDPVITKVNTRARGRYVSIKIENDDLQESWRYGTFTADIKPDGRR